jgi:hypothetical protein
LHCVVTASYHENGTNDGLLTEIKAMQVKTDANFKEMIASQERTVTNMDAW